MMILARVPVQIFHLGLRSPLLCSNVGLPPPPSQMEVLARISHTFNQTDIRKMELVIIGSSSKVLSLVVSVTTGRDDFFFYCSDTFLAIS